MGSCGIDIRRRLDSMAAAEEGGAVLFAALVPVEEEGAVLVLAAVEEEGAVVVLVVATEKEGVVAARVDAEA